MKQIILIITLVLVAMAAISTCSDGNDKKDYKELDEAISSGNLSKAEKLLKDVDNGWTCRHYGGMLIDEYLAIDKLDKAIYVFEKITGHNPMNNMSGDYTREYSKKIYDALLKKGRYDEAWNYHERSYESENYSGNAPDYFAYMSDVIISMCTSGQSAKAQEFIKQKSIWFLKNVDNHTSGKGYTNYQYNIMLNELSKVYNNCQSTTYESE